MALYVALYLSHTLRSQIDCYEIVSENANHTEGTLRAHFERAISCTPCLLVLRNIDALAQTTQPSEGQKGMINYAHLVVTSNLTL